MFRQSWTLKDRLLKMTTIILRLLRWRILSVDRYNITPCPATGSMTTSGWARGKKSSKCHLLQSKMQLLATNRRSADGLAWHRHTVSRHKKTVCFGVPTQMVRLTTWYFQFIQIVVKKLINLMISTNWASNSEAMTRMLLKKAAFWHTWKQNRRYHGQSLHQLLDFMIS